MTLTKTNYDRAQTHAKAAEALLQDIAERQGENRRGATAFPSLVKAQQAQAHATLALFYQGEVGRP